MLHAGVVSSNSPCDIMHLLACILKSHRKYTRALNFENLHDMCDIHTPGPVVDDVCGGGECDVCGGGECIRDC